MTGNQIQYQAVLEQGRHNVATETETNRHNVATETETNRHNVVTEQIDWYNAGSNRISANAAATNAAANYMNAETNRMHLSIDKENSVSMRMNAIANTQNAETNRLNYVNDWNRMQETSRHNKAMESLELQSQAIRDKIADETIRTNKANEAIGWTNTIWHNLNGTLNVGVNAINVGVNALDKGINRVLDILDFAKDEAKSQTTWSF